jgi:ribonuclease J
VIPLGGAGEIGKNMYVVEYGGRMVVIDCGVTFPKNDQMGVDLVLPDFTYVIERAESLEAIILTHGHEDHIGAVPFLLRAVGQVPVYGRRFTLALLRPKLGEHGLAEDAELIEVPYGEPIEIEPFRVEFIQMTHSMPDCAAVALTTPAGTIIHTGDLGIEWDIDGVQPDLPGLARLGDAGVQLLLADSTNAMESGNGAPFPNEDVKSALSALMATARGRILVTTFSSHIFRMQQVLDAAYLDGRAVALVGRSLTRNVNIATNLMNPSTGRPYLTIPPGTLVGLRELQTRPLDEQVILCTGSQGEPMAALSRIARGEHNHVEIVPGDTVVYSSSTVPGNELAVNEIVNRLVRKGARVELGEGDGARFHLSGHGRARDLLLMLHLVRPRHFAPVHGEAQHQVAHARLASKAFGFPEERIHVLDNGDVLELHGDEAGVVEQVHVGLTYVDQSGGGDVAESVLRDRRHLSDDGLVLIIARVDAADGSPLGEVEVVTRGFGPADDEELMEETRLEVERSLAASAEQRVTELGVLQHQLHDAVAGLLRRRTQQRPMVLPVIVEV